MKTKIALLIMLGTVTSAMGSEDCAHTETTLKCVRYVRLYDGDTITFDVAGVHPLLGKNISVRVWNVDTPELRTKDKCEKERGYEAKAFVKKVLEKAKRIDLRNIQRGKYFRIVADVVVDGQSLTEMLLNQKLAYAYDGGTKQKDIDWCKGLKSSRVPATSK